jgi:hypothetical protein
MNRMMLTGLVVMVACDRSPTQGASSAPAGSASDSWIRGDVDQRFALVAKHLRGFDVAMVETGYRYGELYWAGQDRNWGYATYQLEKIETAIANGIERRPKRAASAAMLGPAIARVREVVERQHSEAFAEAFTGLTNTCNACHVAEQVPFVRVAVPSQRMSPVRMPAEAPTTGGSQ